MNSNFSFITGESRPKPKGKSKNDASITPEMWFKELSWIHCMMFCQAFHEADKRNIINPAERAAGKELISMMP